MKEKLNQEDPKVVAWLQKAQMGKTKSSGLSWVSFSYKPTTFDVTVEELCIWVIHYVLFTNIMRAC